MKKTYTISEVMELMGMVVMFTILAVVIATMMFVSVETGTYVLVISMPLLAGAFPVCLYTGRIMEEWYSKKDRR